jgi:hypothetical protein
MCICLMVQTELEPFRQKRCSARMINVDDDILLLGIPLKFAMSHLHGMLAKQV